MQVHLCLDNLGELDSGNAQVVIDAAIRQAVRDLEDRGEDEKPRKVLIELTLTRYDQGLIACQVAAQVKVPPMKTAATLASVRNDRGQPTLLFQTLAPDDPSQQTLDERESK